VSRHPRRRYAATRVIPAIRNAICAALLYWTAGRMSRKFSKLLLVLRKLPVVERAKGIEPSSSAWKGDAAQAISSSIPKNDSQTPGLTTKGFSPHSERLCRDCGSPIPRCRKHCWECHWQTAVYRFVCPDGRSYVGSTHDLRKRPLKGLSRSNRRIKAVIEKFPPETWRFEVLELLPSRRPFHEAVEAEQRHIDRLGTLDPERGFNMVRAAAEFDRWISIKIGQTWVSRPRRLLRTFNGEKPKTVPAE
jgi:hypothetical protein